MSNSVTDWSFTDQVHGDAGGAGITWQCPDCRQLLTYAHGAWWDLECSCVGRDWNLSVSVTWEDPDSVPDDESPELTDEGLLEMWHGSNWFNEGATLREFISIARAAIAADRTRRA